MGIITDVQSSKISLGVPDEADAADTKVDFLACAGGRNEGLVFL